MSGLRNSRYLIVGLGETGISVAHFLRQKNIPFFIVDDCTTPPCYDRFKCNFPEAEVKLGRFEREDFRSAKSIVLSPGVPLTNATVQDAACAGVPVIGDIELFAQHVSPLKSVIAVTGTNGKSTVTTLVADMAARAGFTVAKGGNLGPPALDLITTKTAVDFYVLELSSFQLETTASLKLSASAVLNVSVDHLDRYPDLSKYTFAKQRIHRHTRTAIVNRGEKSSAAAAPLNIISFGLDQGKNGDFGIIRMNGQDCIARGATAWIAGKELSCLPGVAGILNAQAALAIGCAVDLPQSAMLEALKTFTGLPHRLQSLGTVRGIEWINDSKATNVGATVSAFSTMSKPYIWIAGGDSKGADFKPLSAQLDGMKYALLMGCDASRIAAMLRTLTTAPPFATVSNLDVAAAHAMAHATAGDCILLSPACSSLDCYDSYIERGNHFIRLFKEQTCAIG